MFKTSFYSIVMLKETPKVVHDVLEYRNEANIMFTLQCLILTFS